jgi:hypothetical protein
MTQQKATLLLNDDGEASMATAFMMSHHGLRRDIAEFALALERLASDPTKLELSALGEEWTHYRNALHGHHRQEDSRLFPYLRGQNPDLAPVIDGLDADHRRIDPLLEAGDRAFSALTGAPPPRGPAVEAARGVVAELAKLLDAHLATEERALIHLLRGARGFPPPSSEAEAELFAQGFAWSSLGIAKEVIERFDATLSPAVLSRLGEARAKYRARCERVCGFVREGASTTSVPDWLLE